MRLLRFLAVAVSLFCAETAAQAQAPNNNAPGAPGLADFPAGPVKRKANPLTPSLVVDPASIQAGKPFLAGIRLVMQPKWHTYWQFPGEYGKAPKVEWQLPPGFQAGPLQFPLPERVMQYDEVSYAYEHEVILLTEITPPAMLPAGEYALSAKVTWQVCQETCIEGSATVSVAIPPGRTPNATAAADLAKWQELLPQAGAKVPVTWDLTNPAEVKLQVAQLPPEVKVDFYPLPPDGLNKTKPASVSAPDAKGVRTIVLPVEATAPAKEAWRGILTVQKGEGPREGWLVSSAGSPAPSTAAESQPTSRKSSFLDRPAKPAHSLGELLLYAFLGGLILNIMPCVLPVISLKIFGFVNQAGSDPRRVTKLGYAFVAGVIVFFLGMGTAAAVLGKAFHWGFQFTNPYFLTAMISLVFVFGLNLLGVFEITLGSVTTTKLSDLSSQEGYSGAFLHGLFTTLLGTSCTAPVLATALGAVATQPVPVIYLIFLLMGVGLSLPYLLLTSKPAWLKYVPKPGVWMERFKQLMGFTMLGFAVWLFVALMTTNLNAGRAVAWFLLMLGLASWLFGVLSVASPKDSQQPSRAPFGPLGRAVGGTHQAVLRMLGGPIYGLVVALLVAVAGYWFFLHGELASAGEGKPEAAGVAADAEPAEAGKIAWQPFTEQALRKAIDAGKPVFIDFTADWCINCHYFEKTVLSDAKVVQALNDHSVLALRADWSHSQPEVTEWLGRFGRIGVPVYVLFRPGETDPVVKDGLTIDAMLAELGKIAAK